PGKAAATSPRPEQHGAVPLGCPSISSVTSLIEACASSGNAQPRMRATPATTCPSAGLSKTVVRPGAACALPTMGQPRDQVGSDATKAENGGRDEERSATVS